MRVFRFIISLVSGDQRVLSNISGKDSLLVLTFTFKRGTFYFGENPLSVNICLGYLTYIKWSQNIVHFISNYTAIDKFPQKSHPSRDFMGVSTIPQQIQILRHVRDISLKFLISLSYLYLAFIFFNSTKIPLTQDLHIYFLGRTKANFKLCIPHLAASRKSEGHSGKIKGKKFEAKIKNLCLGRK